MRKITKISPQKNSERLNIYLDGKFDFGIKSDLLDTYNLCVGKELDEKLILKIKFDDTTKKCLDKAYHYLSFRPRSEHEVEQKLLEKFEPKVVKIAIKKLKEYRYVDDEAFVKFWITARGKTRGPNLLKSELYIKGIPKDLIDDALSESNPEEMIEDALTLIASKRKYSSLANEDLYKKLAPFLARRGYSYEVIREIIKKLKD